MCCLLYLYLLSLVFLTLGQQCKWKSDGKTLDLRILSGLTLISSNNPNSPNGWLYPYTPCKNDILRCSSSSNMMVIEQGTNTVCVAWLARFENSIEPTYNEFDNSWTFVYENGQSISSCAVTGSSITIIYKCNELAEPYDNLMVTKPDACTWVYTIDSILACDKKSSSNDELSDGSILLIVVFCIVCAYCIGGYIFNAYKNKEDESKFQTKYIPHGAFCVLFCKWTYAGCCVTKEFIESKINGEKKENYEDISEDL